MNTKYKFDCLSEEDKKEAIELYNSLVKAGEASENEFDNIINYYYEKENKLPLGWFIWWDE